MRANHYYMLTFQTTHDAMGAERALGAFIPVAVMPVLRQVSASCGLALRVEEGDWPRLAQLPWERERCTPYHVGERVERAQWP